MKIKNNLINIKKPPIIIAEISGNHNQSIKNIIKLLEISKKNGVKYIKIQTYTPETITLKSERREFRINQGHKLWGGKTLHDLYKDAHTPWNWHKEIFNKAKKLGLVCFSTPFDESAVDFLETLNVPAYKIASFEITHIPLIKKIAQTKKPVIMSTGMASFDEIKFAIKTLKDNGCKDYAILKCTSTYPSNPKESNLITIKNMKKIFKCEVGISDHTPGIGTSIAAVSLGATIVEKHITLDKKNGAVDSKFSLEPEEFKNLVIETNRAWQSIGKVHYGPTKSEKISLKYRRSIYLIEDIKKGEKITIDKIKIVRPNLGVLPKYLESILGKKAKKNLKKNSPLKINNILNFVSIKK